MDNLQRVLASVYVVAVCAFLLVWMHQESLEAYWQQSYHRAPPWSALETQPLWLAGSRMHGAVARAADVFWQELAGQPEAERQHQPLAQPLMVAAPVLPASVASDPLLPGAQSTDTSLLPEPLPLVETQVALLPVPAVAPQLSADRPQPAAEPVQESQSMADTGGVLAALPADSALPAQPAQEETAAESPTRAQTLYQFKQRVQLEQGQRLLFAGDSMMQGVAPHLASRLRREHGLSSLDLSRQSTGLAYPKAFNWPATIEQQLERNKDIAVLAVFLGPNDPWDMPSGRGGKYLRFASPEWEASYRERIRSVIRSAQSRGVDVIWVGPPSMRRQELSRKVGYLSELYESEVLEAGELFVEGNQILGNPDGAYSDYSGDGSQKQKMRAGDGVHFTPAGQRAFANALFELIDFVPLPKAEHDTLTRLD